MLVSVNDYNSLRDRALSLKANKESSYKQMINAQNFLATKVGDLKVIKENRIIQESSIKILQKVIEEMSEEFINSIIDILTYAVKTIFYDEDYSIGINIIETKKGNQAEIILKDANKGTETEINKTGGGVRQVVSFVLQVFLIMHLGNRRIMIMDESLSAISDEYLDTLMQFIKQLSDERDFIFIGVVHDKRFLPFSDEMYKMEKGVLTRIESEDIDYE